MNFIWQQKASLPPNTDPFHAGREGAIGVSLNGKGYIGFGNPIGTLHQISNRIADLMEYDPVLGWKALWIGDINGNYTSASPIKQNGPPARANTFAFGLGTSIYVGSGYGNGYQKDFWEFNISTKSWKSRNNLQSAFRVQSIGFAMNGKGYVGTGQVLLNDVLKTTNDMWEFTPPNSWKQIPDYPLKVYSAFCFSTGTKAYVGGGINETGQPSLKFYSYNGNAWNMLQDIPRPITAGVGFSVNNFGYAGAGSDTGDPSDFYRCSLIPPVSWSTLLPPLNPGRRAAVGFGIGVNGYVSTGYTGADNLNDLWQLIIP